MVKIAVDNASLQRYGQAAGGAFRGIRAELEGLVSSSVTVPYEGPNAADFKRGCGKLAADFSAAMLHDITTFTAAVRDVTSQIARTLGGSPLSIEVNGSPIAVPSVPPGDPGITSVDTGPLNELAGVVNRHFAQINARLDEHLSAFQAAKWEGNAREAAHQALTRFTSQSKADASAASAKLQSFISDQIQATMAADAT